MSTEPFDHQHVPLPLLRERAFNLRWATLPEDVIPLTAADPDFAVAPPIRSAIAKYAEEGVFSYGHPMGLPSFRQAAAAWLERDRGISVSPEQLLVTNSTASALFVAAQHLLAPGDEALIMDPVDFLFDRAVSAAEAVAVRFPVGHDSRIDLDALKKRITPRTRALFVCNPHNPLGVSFRKGELLELAEVAHAHQLWVVSDEIWSDVVYEPHTHTSFSALDHPTSERTLSVFGFSKTFGLAGLRVGLLVAPSARLSRALGETAGVPSTAYGVSTLSQVAAEAALKDGWGWVAEFKAHLRTMRDLCVSRLNGVKGVECHIPESTYVAFPNVSQICNSSVELTEFLLKRHRVALVPGAPEWFGPRAEGHLRICFSTSEKLLSQGLNRIADGLAAFSNGER